MGLWFGLRVKPTGSPKKAPTRLKRRVTVDIGFHDQFGAG